MSVSIGNFTPTSTLRAGPSVTNADIIGECDSHVLIVEQPTTVTLEGATLERLLDRLKNAELSNTVYLSKLAKASIAKAAAETARATAKAKLAEAVMAKAALIESRCQPVKEHNDRFAAIHVQIERINRKIGITNRHFLSYYYSLAFECLKKYKTFGVKEDDGEEEEQIRSNFSTDLTKSQLEDINLIKKENPGSNLPDDFDTLYALGHNQVHFRHGEVDTRAREALDELNTLYTDIYTGSVNIPDTLRTVRLVFLLYRRASPFTPVV